VLDILLIKKDNYISIMTTI